MKKSIYSLCGMCSVRCPIRCEVTDGRVSWIEGNPHLQQGALCGKGSAGTCFVYNETRPKGPMIRQGSRGAGQWRSVSWDRALDYIAEKLNPLMERYGGRCVMLSSRGGPFQDLPQTFLQALGSPNLSNHDASCGRNVHHASQSVTGMGRKGFVYDIKNTKHLVLFGRNMLEALRVSEARTIMDARKRGMKMTVADVRASVTASKASRFWMLRPASDYALLLGIIHEVLKQGAYDKDFVSRYALGLSELETYVERFTPQWAATESCIPAEQIRDFVQEINEDRPKVIFHPGWMFSRYHNSFGASRCLHILNVLMGNIETEGGQLLPKDVKDAGAKGLQSLKSRVPKVTEKRADGVGWKYKHLDAGPGLHQLFYPAMMTGEPYPLKAYILYRHDPLVGFPDREAQLAALDKLDLIVSIDAKYGETTWFSDVILPNCGYLEKDSPIIVQKGAKPRMTMRRKVIDPVYDSKPEWWIFKELAKRLGAGQYFPYESIEELWQYQLEGTGITLDQFEEKGYVELVSENLPLKDREEIAYKTPSGKIEFFSQKLADAGLPSFPDYEKPPELSGDRFRVVFGRHAIHTQGQTQNNPYLHEVFPTNSVWIHRDRARELGIEDKDLVEVFCDCDQRQILIPAHVTEFVHPDALFLYHGFGRTVPLLHRAYNQGADDQKLCRGTLKDWDPAGGGVSLSESFVRVRKAGRLA